MRKAETRNLPIYFIPKKGTSYHAIGELFSLDPHCIRHSGRKHDIEHKHMIMFQYNEHDYPVQYNIIISGIRQNRIIKGYYWELSHLLILFWGNLIFHRCFC